MKAIIGRHYAISKKLVVFTVLYLFYATKLYAQTTRFELSHNDKPSIEKLRQMLFQTEEDTLRAKYFILSAKYYLEQPDAEKADMDSARINLKRALSLALRLQSKQYIHNSLMQFAQYYAEIKNENLRKETYSKAVAIEKRWGEKRLEAESRWFQYFSLPQLLDAPTMNRAREAYIIHAAFGITRDEKLREAYLLKDMADMHLALDKFDLSISELLTVISLQKNYKYNEICYSYDLLSGVYQAKGEISKSLYYALFAVKTVKTLRDKKDESEGYFFRRIANIYATIGNFKEAEIWCKKGYKLINLDHQSISLFTNDYCNALIENGNPRLAIEVAQDVWKRKKDKFGLDAQWIKLTLASGLVAAGNHVEAEKYFHSLLKFVRENQSAGNLGMMLSYELGKSYLKQRNYSVAEAYLQEVYPKRMNLSLYMRMKLEKLLSDVRIPQGKLDEAISNLNRYNSLRDTLFIEQRLSAIDRLRVEFDSSQKENENEILRKKSQLQAQELKQARFVKNTTTIGIAVLILIVILIYSRFRLKSKTNKMLTNQKNEVDHANLALEISLQQKNKLICEKESLIKEVHHRVKNNLQLTMSLLNSQSHYLNDSSAIAAIKQSQHRLKSISLIHQKLYQTENVGKIDLKAYIMELINYLHDSLNDGKKIKFNIELVNLEMEISKAVPIGIFINEAITNIYKYAFPNLNEGRIIVCLEPNTDDSYSLLIKDNGIGLPKNFDSKDTKTLGMALMEGLSQQIEGNLIISDDHGTNVLLIFKNGSSTLNMN